MKVDDFKNLVKQYEFWGLQWWGKYEGRHFHKGYAVLAIDMAGMNIFMNEVREKHHINLPDWDHRDNIGYHQLFSWEKKTIRYTRNPSGGTHDG